MIFYCIVKDFFIQQTFWVLLLKNLIKNNFYKVVFSFTNAYLEENKYDKGN